MHRQARGKNNILIKLSSPACSPKTIGSVQAHAAMKQASLSDMFKNHLYPDRLPRRRRQQIVKWKKAPAKPKVAPNFGTAYFSCSIVLAILLVDTRVSRNLIKNAFSVFRMKGLYALSKHSKAESFSQHESNFAVNSSLYSIRF